ncbi:hypothetical protein N0V82_000965 [Gnomoniopsis sp. IMI 355080]|nr:hypothetical protein N0V82_000965 [Gnomoniopsis sp. IMI 355080]
MATVGVVAGLVGLAAYMYGPATHGTLTKFGVFRDLTSSPLTNADDLISIHDTTHCEDLHYYAPANTLFTACEDVSATRFKWFPPLVIYNDPQSAWSAKGSIHTIDPETKESKRLAFEDFDGPFITHGIDVISDPALENEAVYILAINHVPNEVVFPRDGTKPETVHGSTPKPASRIEVFHHKLGSSTIKHVRSISHPLIKTPNDVYAVSPTEVYVTNDHYYFEGHWRTVEDVWPGAKWSNVIHAKVSEDGSVEAEPALEKLHNPNGLGHGRTEDEILLASATGGNFWIAKLQEEPKAIILNENIDMESTLDNPSWFSDPFADEDTGDSSGFVLGGLMRAVDLPKNGHDPEGRQGVMVWHVTANKTEPGKWEKKLMWKDDGSKIRNAATAVLVGIDPKKEGGKKKAWLFVTGFSSENTVAVKVSLD